MQQIEVESILEGLQSLSEDLKVALPQQQEPTLSNIDKDVTFFCITRSIIAIEQSELLKSAKNPQDIQKMTGGRPFLLWNLSGRSWSDETRSAFDNQIVDVTWKSLCQYTSAPILSTVTTPSL